MAHEYAERIWDYFVEKIGNEYGVAGLMGNLQAESGLIPYRVQGDFSDGYEYSVNYTAMVDAGLITEEEFVYAGPKGGGYGLAQWTFSSRKQALFNMGKAGHYSSIGSIDLALDYLWEELCTTFAGVLTVLVNAKSVREASDVVLHDFENPADQSVAVEEARAALGAAWYREFTGKEPSAPDKKKKGLPLLLLCLAARR